MTNTIFMSKHRTSYRLTESLVNVWITDIPDTSIVRAEGDECWLNISIPPLVVVFEFSIFHLVCLFQ